MGKNMTSSGSTLGYNWAGALSHNCLEMEPAKNNQQKY